MWEYHFAVFILSILFIKSSEMAVPVGQPDINTIQNSNGQVIKFCNILTSPKEKHVAVQEHVTLVNRQFSKEFCARMIEVDTEYWDVNVDDRPLEGFCLSPSLSVGDVVSIKCDSPYKTVVEYNLPPDQCQRRVYTRKSEQELYSREVQACDDQKVSEDCRSLQSLQLVGQTSKQGIGDSPVINRIWSLVNSFGASGKPVEDDSYKRVMEFCNILPFPASSDAPKVISGYTFNARKFSYQYCVFSTGKTSVLYIDIGFGNRTLDAFCYSSYVDIYDDVMKFKCTFNASDEMHVIDYNLPSGRCQRRVYTRQSTAQYYEIVVRKCDEEKELQDCLTKQ